MTSSPQANFDLDSQTMWSSRAPLVSFIIALSMIHRQCPENVFNLPLFSLWPTSNNHLHFENENITVDGFTAQFQARLSRSDVIVVEKLCPHRLRFLGANYRGRMYVESFCNRLMWLGYSMSGQRTRKSGKLSLTEMCNLILVNYAPAQTSTSNLFATLCVSSW